ncbi:TadE/TadG family type IV pilus assembly protein [Microbacterium sp. No. 7]|uniref:TadE/TadG family type IV pilus assembly protein n=1 Tax=Microbacterium sp. No. 7 TaxID=1714373 RepID=UPI0006D1AABC|nr:TadE/TadG family type IV pilus assembly protein [Microbacterium sp. No. 7]ALJ20008.1 TadE family protein [Microbacterium sp. No. 7]
MPAGSLARCERGSGPVEFVLVGAVLTLLTLAVLQLGLAVYVRALVHDAAVEGAYHAALADTDLADGAVRATAIVDRTIGEGFVQGATAAVTDAGGYPAASVTVVATFPIVGLWGVPEGWEVTAHAPLETLD